MRFKALRYAKHKAHGCVSLLASRGEVRGDREQSGSCVHENATGNGRHRRGTEGLPRQNDQRPDQVSFPLTNRLDTPR